MLPFHSKVRARDLQSTIHSRAVGLIHSIISARDSARACGSLDGSVCDCVCSCWGHLSVFFFFLRLLRVTLRHTISVQQLPEAS